MDEPKFYIVCSTQEYMTLYKIYDGELHEGIAAAVKEHREKYPDPWFVITFDYDEETAKKHAEWYLNQNLGKSEDNG